MFVWAILIALVWSVETPLWLSVVTTVLGGVGIVWRFIKLCIKVSVEDLLD